ncbi:MAG TPA: hypothetical protein VL475_08695, partial [Planctomycetaceae bacterium]|nr:hypothetical protein [Planctomycetaceae bacterium]
AKLLAARRDQTRTIEESRSREARFTSLLPILRAHPALTRFQLYWEAIEQSLAARPLTILDPQATGRRQLWLVDPERFGLPSLPQTSPAVLEGRPGTPPASQDQ